MYLKLLKLHRDVLSMAGRCFEVRYLIYTRDV